MSGKPIRLLSTRPLDSSLLQEAAAEGVVIDTLSFISIEPLTDRNIRSKVGWIAKTAPVVVFTSRNAVQAVIDLLERRPAWQIFCTGHGTRRLVEEHFGAAAMAGVADSAGELAEKIMAIRAGQKKKPKEIVFFCGDQRREELPKRLSDQRIHVEEVIVYKTVLTPKRIGASEIGASEIGERKIGKEESEVGGEPYDGVIFFSPSAVSSFFSVNTLSAEVVLFAIGETTADAIRSKCMNSIFVGDSPDTGPFIRDIVDHYKMNLNNEQA